MNKVITIGYAELIAGTPLLLFLMTLLHGPYGWMIYWVPCVVFISFVFTLSVGRVEKKLVHCFIGIVTTAVVWLSSTLIIGACFITQSGLEEIQ
jgi:hypothetical protein